MRRDELKVIKQAIINEIEGYEFYSMAAKQVGNKESKTAFLELAKEELKHVEYLRELFDKIKDQPSDDFELSFISEVPSPKIYEWDKVEDPYISLAVSVFGIGIQMEQASIEFYEEARINTKYDEAKKLYDILIGWEKVHLEQFTDQYAHYKEAWWQEQGFAPF